MLIHVSKMGSQESVLLKRHDAVPTDVANGSTTLIWKTDVAK